jgi:TatA/E family protein of Tat protein translocase
VVTAEILGPDLLIVVILAVVLLFGADRLPKLVRSLGEASRELKGEAHQPPTTESDTVTLTKAELDALLAEREAQARKEAP